MHQYATLEDTVYFFFGANDTSGSGADGATPVYDVRLGGAAADAAPTLSGNATLLAHANYPAGAHEVAIAATAANGFAAGNTYGVFCTLLVDSQNPTGFVGSFKLAPVPANVAQWLGTAPHAATVNGVPVVQLHDSAGAGGINAPANFEDLAIVDTAGTVAVPTTQKVDVETIKTKAVAVDASGTTFPAGTIANTTNITGGVITTVTTLTNLPAVTNDWLTGAGVKADAVTKIQAGLATPTNITAGTIATVTNAVVLPAIPANWITAAGIADAAIDNATFAADVGSTAYATNIIALAADKALVQQRLDHLVAAADSDDVVTDSILAKMAASDGDWSGFDKTTDSLEALRDQGDAAWGAGTVPTAAAIADAVWDELVTGHTDAGKAGAQLWTDVDAILADTGELQTDWKDGGRLDVILDAVSGGAAVNITSESKNITSESNP